MSIYALILRQTPYYKNSVLYGKLWHYNLFFRKCITTFLKWQRQHKKKWFPPHVCLCVCISFKALPLSHSLDRCTVSCPAWGQATLRGSYQEHVGSGVRQALRVRHPFLAPRFFSENVFRASCGPSLCWFALCLPCPWWERQEWGCYGLPWREGHCWVLGAARRAPWKPRHHRRPASLWRWGALDHFLSGWAFCFSYLTFSCALNWETDSPNRRAQVIIKNTLQSTAWQYLH